MSYKDDKKIMTDKHHGKFEERIWDEDLHDGLVPPEEAVKIMSDKWIEDGNWCRQTIYDMVEACSDIIHEITPNNVDMNTAKCEEILKKIRDIYIICHEDLTEKEYKNWNKGIDSFVENNKETLQSLDELNKKE